MVQKILWETRSAARQLKRQPGFTLTAIITLTLAIGANTTIFSLVNGLLLRPLPYPQPERLVHLGQTLPELENIDLSLPDFDYWRQNTKVFAGMAVYDDVRRLYSGRNAAERIEGAQVTRELFQVLGVEPVARFDETGASQNPANRS